MATDSDAWVDEARAVWKKLRPEADQIAKQIETAGLSRDGTKFLAMMAAAYFTGTASIEIQKDPRFAKMPLREVAKYVMDLSLDAIERNFSDVPPSRTN